MAMLGWAKHTRARAKFRGDATRVRVYFSRPTIAIAKIRDYSQSMWTVRQPLLRKLSEFSLHGFQNIVQNFTLV